MHGAEAGLNALEHCPRHNVFDLRFSQSVLHIQFARLQLMACQLESFCHLFFDALLHLLGRFLTPSGANGFHQLLLERHIQQRRHQRHAHRLELWRHGFDHFAHGVELLATVGRAAWHILQGHHQTGALQVVGQIRVAVLIGLGLVDHHRAVGAHCVTLNHDALLFPAQVLHQHSHQQFAHLRTPTLEVAHHVGQRLVGLLHLGLLLHARCGRTAPATEGTRCCRVHPLDRLARISQQLQLARSHLVITLHLKGCALLGHVHMVKHNVCVQAAHSAAKLLVRHGHGTLGALYSVSTHAPAQARIS